MRITFGIACAFLATSLMANLQAQTITGSMPFTAGDLILYRVGDSGDSIVTATNVTTDVWLDEYTEAGALVGSMEMPTNAVGAYNPLTANGASTSEGLLTISPNEQYIALTGYDSVSGLSNNAPTATSALVNRTVGILNVSNGQLDTSTALTDASSASSVRSAITTDGTNIWVDGGAGGARYTTRGATTSVQLATGTTNLRQIEIYPTAANPNGQLMISSASGSARLDTVGAGLPTTSGQTLANLPGTTGTSPTGPYAFVQLTLGSGTLPDTMYVADDGASAIEKWSLESGSWVETGSEAMTAPRGITAVVTNGVVDVFVTSGSSTVITNIDKFVDASGLDGTFSSGTNIITQLPAGEQFRGVVELTLVPEPSTVMLVAAGMLGLFTIRRRRS